MRDLTARALNHAQVRGASYADVRIVTRLTQRIAVKNGQVEALAQDETQGVGVRVIANGAWGFASSSRLDAREIERVVTQATAIAKASSMVKNKDLQLGPPVTVQATYTTPVRE